MALFISFEGGEGSGKSTQAELLRVRLASHRVQSLLVHEPGTTDLGRHIRWLIKGRLWGAETISSGSELFLFAAARAELVAKFLKPALAQPEIVVIADRYADSTMAYQGYGRNLGLDLVRGVNELATQGLKPDITFLLDCRPEVGLKRVGSLQIKLPLFEGDASPGRIDSENSNRFEEEPLAFHERVRQGYLRLAESDPDRWVVIDAMEPQVKITKVIWDTVLTRLEAQSIQIEDVLPDDLLLPSKGSS